jgi:(S)-ureidoglycine aminohydrolase
MKILLFPALLFASLVVSAQAVIPSQLYSWKKPSGVAHENILSSILFEGRAHDMAYFNMSANEIVSSGKKTLLETPADEEHLLIVKSGTLSISMRDSSWSVGKGSVAVIMPGENYSLQNAAKDVCTFYSMKYRSALPKDDARGKRAGGSFVKDWNKIPFKPHDKGGIRNYFERPTAMGKRLEMHVTTLKEGIKSHEPHTHKAEEIVLVIDNKTEMQIGDKFYKGGEGSIYYLGSDVPHAIQNDGVGTCTYFAFQFE